MKLFALIIIYFTIVSNVVAQEFSFKMLFEDSEGNTDSLIIGYDPIGTWGVDPQFGEENIHGQDIDSTFDVRVSDELESPIDTILEYDTYSLKKQIIKKDCDKFPSPITINIRCKNWPITATWDSTLFKTECLEGSVLTSVDPGGWWDVGSASDLGRVLLNQRSRITFTSNIRDYDEQDSISVFWVAMATKNHLSLEVNPIIHDSEVIVFPNPTNGRLFIQSKTGATILQLELIDMLEKKHPIELASGVANIENCKSGIYLLRISYSDQSVDLQRIIKL